MIKKFQKIFQKILEENTRSNEELLPEYTYSPMVQKKQEKLRIYGGIPFFIAVIMGFCTGSLIVVFSLLAFALFFILFLALFFFQCPQCGKRLRVCYKQQGYNEKLSTSYCPHCKIKSAVVYIKEDCDP